MISTELMCFILFVVMIGSMALDTLILDRAKKYKKESGEEKCQKKN